MLLNSIRRKIQSKGHGIHSPFAFEFITKIIYSDYDYYAFSDIKKLLAEAKREPYNERLHHLSYRLIQYFKPNRTLEINPENNINSLYISHSRKEMILHNLEKDADNKQKYDAIFIYSINGETDIDLLLSISEKNSFWLLSGINSGTGKHIWRKIVKDSRVQFTFDMKDIGIVVLREDFLKSHYLI